VAKTYHCNLRGFELEAFNLFRIFSGLDGPAVEFEFHMRGNKARWIKLAWHVLGKSMPSPFNDPVK
jgi:hypothetical protein